MATFAIVDLWYLIFCPLLPCCSDFLSKEYVGMKKANPKFPILVRECSGVTPKIWARFGKEDQSQLVGLLN
jgi:NADH dehydrogenase (ubiquinone) 1 alpha subcomplex subunit 2